MWQDEYGLEEIHKLLLDGLNNIDEVCRNSNIKYSLHGGALLGAERNKQLIPWDDDLDISMMRDEYMKFRKAININEVFFVNEKYLWVPRLIFRRDGKTVFIDIFVYDYITENHIGQIIKINILRFLQGMMRHHIYYKHYSILNQCLLFITHILGKLFSENQKRNWYQWISKNFLIGKKRFIHRSNDSFYGISYIFDADFMSEYIDIELAGKRYMANKRYREFLVRNYGENYMTPPPVSERKPAHRDIVSEIEK